VSVPQPPCGRLKIVGRTPHGHTRGTRHAGYGRRLQTRSCLVDSVRRGWDLQLTEYDAERWRATFFVAGQAHSIRRRLGVGVDAVASDAARGVGDVDEVRALAHSFDSGLAIRRLARAPTHTVVAAVMAR
jgi:hypothetical protein